MLGVILQGLLGIVEEEMIELQKWESREVAKYLLATPRSAS